MTENENTQAMQGQEGAQDGEQEAGIALQKIYVKDISFESPNAPEIFSKPWAPEYNMDLHTKNAKLADNIYEVVVSVTLTCTLEGMTAYIVEVQQADVVPVVRLLPHGEQSRPIARPASKKLPSREFGGSPRS